jgi:hypothetical protein
VPQIHIFADKDAIKDTDTENRAMGSDDFTDVKIYIPSSRLIL